MLCKSVRMKSPILSMIDSQVFEYVSSSFHLPRLEADAAGDFKPLYDLAGICFIVGAFLFFFAGLALIQPSMAGSTTPNRIGV